MLRGFLTREMAGSSMTIFEWHFRKTQAPPALPLSIASRIQHFQECKRLGEIPHTRARSKQKKDQTRARIREERQRILHEAFHDNVDSVGEVDALTDSQLLDVSRGEVLRDPKVRYVHPSLTNTTRRG
jgi:hypothetical protein